MLLASLFFSSPHQCLQKTLQPAFWKMQIEAVASKPREPDTPRPPSPAHLRLRLINSVKMPFNGAILKNGINPSSGITSCKSHFAWGIYNLATACLFYWARMNKSVFNFSSFSTGSSLGANDRRIWFQKHLLSSKWLTKQKIKFIALLSWFLNCVLG